MASSDRIPLLAQKISAHIRAAGLPLGSKLPERQLAAMFDLSRSPVKQALRLLADRDVVSPHEDGGFVVSAGALEVSPVPAPERADETAYLALARDHLAGAIPKRVSENELMRRYGLTRHAVASMLRRAAHEGWVERLPGHGWRFLEVLTSPEIYAQAYRYRILVEPAAVLDPAFVPDRPALLAIRTRHEQMLNGDMTALSPASLFETATEFHTNLIRCSNNVFLIDGLARLKRLRRLIEYQATFDLVAWAGRCAEHIEILDFILANDRQRASLRLREHLERGAAAKT